MKEIILIGAGGHCHSCIDVIETSGEFKIKGLIDKKERIGEVVLGYKIIGSDEDLPELIKKNKNVLITLGQIKSAELRIKLFERIKKLGGEFPVVISSRAHVSRHAQIGEGTIIMHDALVNAGARIGKNSIINSKALCEHDVVIGDHCHISTGAILNGNCHVGSESFVGSNTVLKQGSKVPSKTVVPYGIKYE